MSQPPPPPRRSKTAVVAVREAQATAKAPKATFEAPHGQGHAHGNGHAHGQGIDAEAADSSVVYRAVDFEHSVHLDGHGNILAGNGKLDELASLAAYVCRIGSLVGQQFSFGDVTGVEATLASGTFFMNRDANGEIVSIKPRPHLNLIQLRTQLNL
jgi:hypothetical protein